MSIEDEQMKKLRAPFTIAAVKFRPLEKPNDKGIVSCLVYIDSRLAAERLSTVDPGWSSSYEVLAGPDQHMPVVCKLTVCGVTREGVGQNAGPLKDDKHAKMAFSDALKRAAVEFGVGASLYAMPRFAVDKQGYWLGRNGKVGGLTPLGVRGLRAQYQKAIAEKVFVERFGQPIDHGDYLLPDEDLAGVPDVSVGEQAAMPKLSDDQREILTMIAAACGHTPDLDDVPAADYAQRLTAFLKFAVDKAGVVDAATAEDIQAAALTGSVQSVRAHLNGSAVPA